jgi:hypothetical protein
MRRAFSAEPATQKTMRLTKCFGTSDLVAFVASLTEEIQENWLHLHLDDYLEHGGSIGGCVEIQDLGLDSADGGELLGHFCISFEESYFNGCRDISWAESYHGRMRFSLNLETREFQVVSGRKKRVVSEAEELDDAEAQGASSEERA